MNDRLELRRGVGGLPEPSGSEPREALGLILLTLRFSQLALAATVLCLLVSVASAVTPGERLLLARGYLQRGEVEFAKDELEAIVAEQPPDSVKAEATYWLGECYYRLEMYQLAIAHFEDVARMPGDAWKYDALIRTGDGYLALEEFGNAATSFRAAQRLGQGREKGEAAYWLGVALSRYGRDEEAARAFAAAASLDVEEAEQAAYMAARSAMAAGAWALAESLWTAFAGHYPLSEQVGIALYSLGHLSLRQDDETGAVGRFEELLRRFPDGPHAVEALLMLGELELRSGNSERAVMWLRRFLDSRPPPEMGGRGALALGRALREAGRDRAAIAVLDSLAQARFADSVAVRALIEGAEMLYARGEFQESATRLRKALGQGVPPDEDISSRRLLGWSLYQDGRWRQARDVFAELSRRSGDDPAVAAEASHMTAQSLAKMESLSEAVAALRSSLSEFPGWASADRSMIVLAHLLEAEGETGEAIDVYVQLATSYPSSEKATEARLRAGQLLLEEGREAEARELLGPLAAEGHVEASYWLAEAHYRLGQPGEAAKQFDTFLEAADPKDPLRDEAWHGLAWSQVRLEMPEKAEQTLTEMLREVPDSPLAAEAYLKLGSLRYEDGRVAEAALAFRKLLERYPLSEHADEALYWLGWSLVAQDSLETACQTFRRLDHSYEGSQLVGRARLAGGKCLLSLGRFEEALVEIRAALRSGLSPEVKGEAWAALARAHLDLESSGLARAAIDSALAAGAEAGEVAPTILELGAYWLDRGEYAGAAALLDSLALIYPSSPEAEEARYLVSIARLRMGDAEGAFSGFQMLADSPDPEVRAMSLLAAGRVAAERGLHEQAAGWYRRATEAATDTLMLRQALLGHAFELLELGRGDAAAPLLERLTTSYPSGRDELWMQGALRWATLLLDQGNATRAINVAKELAGMGGATELRAHLILGNAYRSLGRHREAVIELQSYAARHSDPTEAARALYTAALSLMALEDWSAAASAFEAATAVPELAPQALLAQGWCLQKAGRDSLAEGAYREMLWRVPGTIRAWEAAYRLAELVLAKERSEEAAAVATEALKEGAGASDWGDDLVLVAARALEAAGRSGEALIWYGRLIAEHPSSALVPYAESRVRSLRQPQGQTP